MRNSSLLIAGLAASSLALSPLSVATASTATDGAATAAAAAGDQAGKGPGKKAMKAADKWAKTKRVKKRRQCRSGNDYEMAQKGYYGAYGLNQKVWKKYGGKQFAQRADKASKSEQNYVARNYTRARGIGVIGCDTQNWMKRVYSAAADTPLSEMLIPGTHDSGTAGISTTDPCTTQAAYGKAALPQDPCLYAAMVRAQGLTLGEQLEQGVRYLDLRVGVPADEVLNAPPVGPAPDPASVPLVLQHNLVAEPLTEALAGVQRFIAEHPEEQVILDFQEVKFPDDPAIAAYYKKALDGVLTSYVPRSGLPILPVCDTAWSSDVITVPDNKLGTGVPIRKAWRKGVSALVYFKDSDKPSASTCYRTRWASDGFLWPNTESPQQSTSDNVKYLKERKQRISSGKCVDAQGNNWCGINVSQLQLTPRNPQTYIDCVATKTRPAAQCSLRYFAGLVNNNIVANVKKWRFKQDLPVNIAMVDWIQQSKPRIADGLISLNWRLAD